MQPWRARVSAIIIEQRGLRASSLVTSAFLSFGKTAHGSSVFMVCDPVAVSFASKVGIHIALLIMFMRGLPIVFAGE